jgi:hypothetical protein
MKCGKKQTLAPITARKWSSSEGSFTTRTTCRRSEEMLQTSAGKRDAGKAAPGGAQLTEELRQWRRSQEESELVAGEKEIDVAHIIGRR